MLQGQEELPEKSSHQALREATLGMLSSVEIVERRAIAILQHQDIFATKALEAFQQSQYVGMCAYFLKRSELLEIRAAARTMEALDGHFAATFAHTLRYASACHSCPTATPVGSTGGARHSWRTPTCVAQRICHRCGCLGFIDLGRNTISEHLPLVVEGAPASRLQLGILHEAFSSIPRFFTLTQAGGQAERAAFESDPRLVFRPRCCSSCRCSRPWFLRCTALRWL
mmetsp:Transcript_46350/g.83644  ORF Transcript_46350/g.83644 Transcript_46350/m.83644 type:complete len:227 (+) Transcript_46350:1268-1948(+)